MQYNRMSINSIFIFMILILDMIFLCNLQIAIVMRAERNPVFATSRMVFAYVKKDTVALDAINVFLDITAIPTAYRVIAAPSAHQVSVAILRANAHASLISPEELAINAVQDTTNTRSASVYNLR